VVEADFVACKLKKPLYNVIETDQFRIRHALHVDAVVDWSKQTAWCTKHRPDAESYLESGHLFAFYNKGGKGRPSWMLFMKNSNPVDFKCRQNNSYCFKTFAKALKLDEVYQNEIVPAARGGLVVETPRREPANWRDYRPAMHEWSYTTFEEHLRQILDLYGEQLQAQRTSAWNRSMERWADGTYQLRSPTTATRIIFPDEEDEPTHDNYENLTLRERFIRHLNRLPPW